MTNNTPAPDQSGASSPLTHGSRRAARPILSTPVFQRAAFIILHSSLVIFLLATPALAQDEPPAPLRPFRLKPETEKPKPAPTAVPIKRPNALPPPAPMPDDPVERPTPKSTPKPAPNPTPLKPKPAPKPTPSEVEKPAPVLADPAGEIRMAPRSAQTPDQIQMAVADGFYIKKMYDMAAPEYERYLAVHQGFPERQAALYRLGECYRINGVKNGSRNAYETLLSEYREGEFVGPAAYRLAEMLYEEKNYLDASERYRRAAVRLKDAKLVNACKFYIGRCLEGINAKTEARMQYEALIGSSVDNPFYDASRHSLALLYKDAGRTAEALKQIDALAAQTANAAVRAEALTRSGLWLIELQQPETAAKRLNEALAIPDIGRWKSLADFGLLQIQFDAGKYKDVVKIFDEHGKDFSAEVRPQLLLLVGQSNRQLGENAAALVLFEQVMAEAAGSVFAREAAGERLKCLYYADDPKLLEEIDKYIAGGEAQKTDEILLMKAEVLFKKNDFATAAPLYEQISESKKLTGVFKSEALAKLIWCYNQLKDNDRTIEAASKLIKGYPTYNSTASILAQRASAYLRKNQLTECLADLDRLTREYPKAKERERALHQKALIHNQRGENDPMADAYRILLRDYPDTSAAPEANYWIGRVAYEKKTFKEALEPLRAAIKGNREEYFERGSLLLMVCAYELDDVEGVAREIDAYVTGGGKAPVRYEMLTWIGAQSFDAAEKASAANNTALREQKLKLAVKYLEMVRTRGDAQMEDLLRLGKSQLALSAFAEAGAAFKDYLGKAKDPAPKANALILLGQSQTGAKKYDEAQKSCDEAIALQPDGEINAEARILAGDIQTARGRTPDAAKVYESVAVVIDHETITPRALEKAVAAYRTFSDEENAKRLENKLKSAYPEYWQKKQSQKPGGKK